MIFKVVYNQVINEISENASSRKLENRKWVSNFLEEGDGNVFSITLSKQEFEKKVAGVSAFASLQKYSLSVTFAATNFFVLNFSIDFWI